MAISSIPKTTDTREVNNFYLKLVDDIDGLDTSVAAVSVFKQIGTGSVDRTPQEKMRDVLSVKDFGAVGTADDTVVFTAALNASIAAGKALVVPGNTVYTITSQIVVTPTADNKHCEILFEGGAEVTFNGSTGFLKLNGTGANGRFHHNVRIRGGLFYPYSAGSGFAIELWACSEVLLDGPKLDCSISSHAANGFLFDEVWQGNVFGVYVYGAPIGIQYQHTTNDLIISSCDIEACTTYGIYSPSGQNNCNIITKNYVEGSVDSIVLASATSDSEWVVDNYINTGSGSYAILANGNKTIISRNCIETCSAATGIKIDGQLQQVLNNMFQTSSGGDYAIRIHTWATRALVLGNTGIGTDFDLGFIIDASSAGTSVYDLNYNEAGVYKSNKVVPLTASCTGDIALNNIANYFDGPAVVQGAVGTWLVTGTVTLTDTAGAATFRVTLSDGTTTFASCRVDSTAANQVVSASLSGYITAPASNIRIAVRDVTSTSGKILHDSVGFNNDSTITAIRIY